MIRRAVFMFFGVLYLVNSTAQQIEITITQIRNPKGSILLSFYQNSDNFPYKPEQIKIVDKLALKDSVLKVCFDDFKYGIYAITLLDDENEDKDMNYKFFIPEEGYGFSNFVHSGLFPPSFSDCKFNHDKEITKVAIKVQYW